MSPGKVNTAEKLALFDGHWSPKIVGELNGQHVKLLGPFVCHHHDEEDEMFIVVGRGVEHRPVAEEEAHVMLLEPASTLDTGSVRDERTVEELERI